MKTQAKPAPKDCEFTITRTVSAPRDLVWKVWTDPKHVVNWWGPNGFSTTIHEMDFRVGGTWRHTMRGPDGTEYPNKSVFDEIVHPERIVYAHGGGQEGGPSHLFIAYWTFEAEGDKTRVTLRMVFPTPEDRNLIIKQYSADKGAAETFGRLQDYAGKLAQQLGDTKDFVLTRTFDAPRDLVFKAWTEPRRLMEWFGPKGSKIHTTTKEIKPGGVFHYSMTMGDKVMWGKWVIREIVPPSRLVVVTSFSDEKQGITRHPMAPDWPLEMLSTTTFEEKDGKTLMTLRWRAINATEAERKTFDAGHEGMRQGWGGAMEMLEAYLAEQTKSR